MHTSRITNASLFVTVLSACLGLVSTAAPSDHAQAQPGETVVSRSQAIIAGATVVQLSPQRTLKLDAASNSFFRIDICRALGGVEENLYQNSRALTDKHRLLVVTRLPRAALSHMLAE
jgi:hypothetical protein